VRLKFWKRGKKKSSKKLSALRELERLRSASADDLTLPASARCAARLPGCLPGRSQLLAESSAAALSQGRPEHLALPSPRPLTTPCRSWRASQPRYTSPLLDGSSPLPSPGSRLNLSAGGTPPPGSGPVSPELLRRQGLQQHSLPDMAGLVRLQPGLQLRGAGAAAAEALLRDSRSSESAISSYSAPGQGGAAGGAASGRTSNNGGGSLRVTRSSVGARSTTDQLELAQVGAQRRELLRGCLPPAARALGRWPACCAPA
jgi:hypothetical protein